MSEDKRVKCLLCREDLGTPHNLELHVKTVHFQMFVCTKCPNFSTLIKMRMICHNKNVHNEDDDDFKNLSTGFSRRVEKRKPDEHESGTVLSKQAKTSSDLPDNDNQNIRFECDRCWFTTETEENLASHHQVKHGIFCFSNDIIGKGIEVEKNVQSQSKTGTRSNTGLVKSSQPVIIQISKSPISSGSVSDLAKSNTESQSIKTSHENGPAANSESTKRSDGIINKEGLSKRIESEYVSKVSENGHINNALVNLDEEIPKKTAE